MTGQEEAVGRKQDINEGAISACFVVAAIIGVTTQSFWGAIGAFFVLGGILKFMGVIR